MMFGVALSQISIFVAAVMWRYAAYIGIQIYGENPGFGSESKCLTPAPRRRMIGKK